MSTRSKDDERYVSVRKITAPILNNNLSQDSIFDMLESTIKKEPTPGNKFKSSTKYLMDNAKHIF